MGISAGCLHHHDGRIPQVNDDKTCFGLPFRASPCSGVVAQKAFGYVSLRPHLLQLMFHSNTTKWLAILCTHRALSFLCDFAQSYLSAWTGFPQFVTRLTSPHPLSFNSDATSSRKPSLTSFSPCWMRHPSSALLGQLSSNLFVLLPCMFSPLHFQNLVLDENQCVVPGTK